MAVSPKTKQIKIQLLVLIGAILLVSILAIGVYTKDIVSANQATVWPTSEGIVIYSDAVNGCSNDSAFWPKVHYQYRVEGQTYIGENLVFGNFGCGSKENANSILQQFPMHANVTVHFDPEDPGVSVLLVGMVFDDTWSGIYFFTGLFAAFSLFGFFVARKY